MRLDGVDAVAIGAHRRLPVALGNCCAVDALLEFLGDRVVALAASRWHVEFEDGRLRIFRVEDLVRAMAIGADGGLFRSGGNRMSVDALLIRGDHLRAEPILLHHELLAVTGSAGRRDVGVMHPRIGIARWQQFVRAAVTIDAGCRAGVTALCGFAVEAAIVGRLLVGMAGGAADFLGSVFVR